MLCATRFLCFAHYSATATLIMHFDCTGNNIILILRYTVSVCVCAFVSSIFYHVNTTPLILYNLQVHNIRIQEKCAVPWWCSGRGCIHCEKQFIFPALGQGQRSSSDSTPKNADAFLFTYFISNRTIIIIVLYLTLTARILLPYKTCYNFIRIRQFVCGVIKTRKIADGRLVDGNENPMYHRKVKRLRYFFWSSSRQRICTSKEL